MKDFIKWLGVNEKVAKVAVWLLIIMVFLITFNAGLESLGFPNYKITYDNLISINVNKTIDYIIACIVSILNFYSMVLLVLRVKEIKKIFWYAILYLILNIIIINIFPYIFVQIFIILYTILFCYFYSNRNKKYIIYGLLGVVINMAIQGIWYTAKAKFIDYSGISETTKSILSLDYFIIIAIIILVKEIYLKKRGEKNEPASMSIMDRRIQKRRNSSKESSKKSSKQN